MNYLAHLFLSCDDEDHLLGNFIADSIKRPEGMVFRQSIKEGIHLHKLIDQYTDKHPIVKRSTKRLHFKHHHYASVVVDIWYDHLLAKNWTTYSEVSLRDFADKMYGILKNKIDDMPSKMKMDLPAMASDDWLMKYAKMDGMLEMFERLKKRVSRPELLLDVKETFVEVEEGLEADFKEFFPLLQAYIKAHHNHSSHNHSHYGHRH